MRADGFSRWTLRRKARAVRSAWAVTLQVLAMITSARLGLVAGVRPRWRNSALMISPSARLARHPKFSTWYSATLPVYSRNGYPLKGTLFEVGSDQATNSPRNAIAFALWSFS